MERSGKIDFLGLMVSQLGDDELDVLCKVAERAVMGRQQYGNLDLLKDKRDFLAEGSSELVDFCFYGAAAILRGQRAG